MHGLDQVTVDGGINLCAIQSGLQRGIVMSHIRVELKLFHLGRQQCGGGVLRLFVGAVEGLKGSLPHIFIRMLHQRDKASACHGQLFAVGVRDVREGEIRI